MADECADKAPLAEKFSHVLIADGPSPELGARAADLNWLVGSWSAIVRDYDPSGSICESTGEWWFAWVLEGRALQDVWIVPPREAAVTARDRYGTTIRWFDHKAGLWRISWFNPVSGARCDLSGGRDEKRLVFEGIADGEHIRWSFSDITPSGFIWRGEHIDENGDASLGSEFILRRIT